MRTIITSVARCRDCYKCIRHCPVKAIGLKDGQAWVVEEKCVLCGQCIKACPQKAKTTVSQEEQFARLLQEGERVVVSLAPSYLATSTYETPWKLVAGLYQVGVVRVEETAIAAEQIAINYREALNPESRSTVISSCCPVVVDMVEKYFPNLIECFPGLVSPMVAHARQIKATMGREVKTVFIGPCYAKKAEAVKDETDLDLVLTFDELANYFKNNGIDCNRFSDRFPDTSSFQARYFPLTQGILKTSGIEQNMRQDILTVSGIEECLETLNDLEQGLIQPTFIEALACRGGCIGGPAFGDHHGLPARRERLFQNAGQYGESAFGKESWLTPVERRHEPFRLQPVMPTESELLEILALTGKYLPEDETNCGGCGYSSCREKAIAVFQGLAEPEMCIPYMKNKAESFSNTIVDTTFNAILVVDQDLNIQKYNPAASRMFRLPIKHSKGQKLQNYIDPVDFQKVFDTQTVRVTQKSYPELKLYTRQTIYPLPRYGVVIGVISDLTEDEERKTKLDIMKKEAFERASKVIQEQMRIAQEIAGLLGESTSETKATLLELMEIMEGEIHETA